MTREAEERTLVEQLEDNETTAFELAAARAAVHALHLLNSAFQESGMQREDLAVLLGVTEERVSEILDGDGNVRLATLGRVLRASGYRLKLTAEPIHA